MMPSFLLLRFDTEKIMRRNWHVLLFSFCVLVPLALAGSITSRLLEKTLDPVPTMPTLSMDRDSLRSFYRRSRPASSMRPMKSPRPVSWGQYDACGGNILVPLSNDRNILIEQTYKSIDFPAGRTRPLVCSWKVEVSNTNCNRGLVTMTVDELSRLSDEEGCLNGFYRVSPFMKEAKICGRIGTVPPFQWHVDDRQPENVTISLKHIGLNDGNSEGLSFTLTGECLSNEVNVTIDGSTMNSTSHWLARNSTDYGVPIVVFSTDDSDNDISMSNNFTERQGENSEIPLATTTMSPSIVTMPFSLDYYRSHKSTVDHQTWETPTTGSPNVLTRSPANAKSSVSQKPVTKRPQSTTSKKPTTKNTTKKPTPRVSSTTVRPATNKPSTARPPSTTVRPTAGTNRPTTRAPTSTTRPPTKRSSTTRSPPKTTRPATTTKKPTTRPRTTTARPTTKRPSTRPTTRRPDVDDDDNSDMPWLVLKSPSSGGQPFSSDIYQQNPVNTHVNKIAPMPINENGEIPWLIMKTPNHNQLLPKVQPVVSSSLVTKRPATKTTKKPNKKPSKSKSKSTTSQPNVKGRQPTTAASPPTCPQSPVCPVCPVQPSVSSDSGLSFIRRPTMVHSVSWDQYDTCGGTINVPLSFDRLSSYESLHFPAGRNFPLSCTWNVKVRNANCTRGRITLRVDGRSRLADVKGCTKGYYTVFPFMMQAKICGRIGTAPPLHWYIDDDQQPEDVTIVMENIGLDDGRAEGFSFSLQGECIPSKPDVKKLDVVIDNYWSHNRWMSRVLEDFKSGDGPRVHIPGVFGLGTSSAYSEIEPDEPYDDSLFSNSVGHKDEFAPPTVTQLQAPQTGGNRSSTNAYPAATHFTVQSSQILAPDRPSAVPVSSNSLPSVIIRQPATTVKPSTTTRAQAVSTVKSSWINFYDSYESETGPLVHTSSTTTTTVRPWTQVVPSISVPPVTRRPATSARPTPTPTKSSVIFSHSPETPWLILKSPNSTQQSWSDIYSTSDFRLPSTTARPSSIRPTTQIPTTTARPFTKRPSLSSQTISYTPKVTKMTTTTSTRPPPKTPSTTPEPSVGIQAGFYNTEWHTDSSSTFVPTVNGGQLRLDTCRGNVLVPLSSDPNSHQEFITVKSTWFPFNRITPLICSWNVKVSDNCRRGVVTMTVDERSRLADDEDCLRGYYRVAPFMNESKICGRVHTVPAFQWYVDNQQPEDVTIILKHVGLNDGYSEGLAFTLSGECLTDESDLTKSKASKSYNSWMQQLASQSLNLGVPTVVLPDVYQPSSGDYPQSKTNPGDDLLAKENFIAPHQTSTYSQISPDSILSLSSFYPNATSDPTIFSDASDEDLEDLWLILQSPSSKQSLPNSSEEESDDVSLEVSKSANIPVDDVFDDALSYITRLLNETKKIRPLKKHH